MKNPPRRRILFWLRASTALGCMLSAVGCSLPGRNPASQSTLAFSKARQPAGASLQVWSENFDTLNRQRWQEVEVKRKTQYRIADLNGRRCLEAHSHDGASILVQRVDIDPHTDKWLSWEWRVDRLVEGEALDHKRGSDASARVYVYFDTGGLPWQKRNLDYVWSASFPVGTVLDSAFSGSSKIIVVESSAANVGQWVRVERNVLDDYYRCFREEPPHIVAIGIMNDSDNTHGEALAYFDDLRIWRQPFMPTAGRRPSDEMIFMEDD